eukprot:Seg1278.12 transcript_id=Seg1278.12/GoldUCD/mRNA.D3Y31 product="hypothetical protein" protein_id=Seg1278.12/GoldUCD/D3Y31
MAGWFGYDLWSSAPSEEERATIDDQRPKDENWIWVDNEGDHLSQNDVEFFEKDELKKEPLMSYADAVRVSTERCKQANNDEGEINKEESVEKNKNQAEARKQSQKNEYENEDESLIAKGNTATDTGHFQFWEEQPTLKRQNDKWASRLKDNSHGSASQEISCDRITTNEVAIHHQNVCLPVPDRYTWKIVGGKEKQLSKMQKDQANFRAGQFVIDVSDNNGVLSLLRVGSCDTTIKTKTSQKLVELCTVVQDVKLTRKAGKCKIIDLEENELHELIQGIKCGPLTKEQTKRVEKMASSEIKKRKMVRVLDSVDQEFTLIKTGIKYGPLTKEQTIKLEGTANFGEDAGRHGNMGQSGTDDDYMRQFQEGTKYGPLTKEQAMKLKKIRKNTKNKSGKQRQISYEDKATQCCIIESRVETKPEFRIVVESQPLRYLLRIEQQPLSIEWYKEDMTTPSSKSIFNGFRFMESVFVSLMSLAMSMTKIDIVSLEDFQNNEYDIAETETTTVGKRQPKRHLARREKRDEEVEVPPVRHERMFKKKDYKKKVLKCGNKTIFKKGGSNNKNRNFTPQKFSGRGGARAC